MLVTVQLYGTLRRFSLKKTPGVWKGDIPDKSSIADLINLLGAKQQEVALAVINGSVTSTFEDMILPESLVILVTHMGAG